MTSPSPVYTTVSGDNSDLIQQVAELYLPRPDDKIVVDVTYGKGVFWKRVSITKYRGLRWYGGLLSFDLAPAYPGMVQSDFRHLPLMDSSVDLVVGDPPYQHDPGHSTVSPRYGNYATTRGLSHRGIMDLYSDLMKEAYRVLVPGGQCWIKCQDEVVSSKQQRSHIEILDRALSVGFEDQDLFILHRKAAQLQVKRQLHARKNSSFLWVFTKPTKP